MLRNRSVASASPAVSPVMRARMRSAFASRNGGRCPAGSSSMNPSSSSTFVISPSASAASRASTTPAFTPWNAGPIVGAISIVPAPQRRPPPAAPRRAAARPWPRATNPGPARPSNPPAARTCRRAASLVELATVAVGLDAGLEDAEHHSAGVHVLLRELVGRGQRLVPAPQHQQGVGPLRLDAQLVGPAAHPAGECKRLIQVAQGLSVAVEAEAAVREDEVAGARVLEQVVLERDLESLLEECERLRAVSSAPEHGGFRSQRDRQCAREVLPLGDVERQLRPLRRPARGHRRTSSCATAARRPGPGPRPVRPRRSGRRPAPVAPAASSRWPVNDSEWACLAESRAAACVSPSAS